MQTDLRSNVPHYPNESLNFISSTQINSSQKTQSVIFLERTLSCILARNFIQCWDQLKRNYYQNSKFAIKQSIRYRQQSGLTLDQVQAQRQSRRKYHSNRSRFTHQKYRQKQLNNQQNFEQSVVIRKNRSIRIINSQTEQSRANLLKQIADKLKAHKKMAEDQQEGNEQVYRKISKLQAMIRSIKLEQSRQIQSKLSQQNLRNINQNNQIYQKDDQQQQNTAQEQDKLLHQFMTEIIEIRKQIAHMKQNNEQFLKAQIQRSRASEKIRQNSVHQVNYHQKFQTEVLKHDNQIQMQLKTLQNKVDMILQQIKNGSLNLKTINSLPETHPYPSNGLYQHQTKKQSEFNFTNNYQQHRNFNDFSHKQHLTDFSQQTEDKQTFQDKHQQKRIQKNPQIQFQNQALKKIQDNMNELINKIQKNRQQIQRQKNRQQIQKQKNQHKDIEANISILPLTHKNSYSNANIENSSKFSFREQFNVPFTSPPITSPTNYTPINGIKPSQLANNNTFSFKNNLIQTQTHKQFSGNNQKRITRDNDYNRNQYGITMSPIVPYYKTYVPPVNNHNYNQSTNSNLHKISGNGINNGHFSHQSISFGNEQKAQLYNNIKSSRNELRTINPSAYSSHFCSTCGRSCNCLPVPGFIRKY